MRSLIFLTLFFIASACIPQDAPEGEGKRTPSGGKIEVLAAMAVSKEVPLIHRVEGEIVPANRIKIQALFDSKIAKVLVKEGQKITAGTTVARYDNSLSKSKLELAQAEEDEADAAIDYDQFRLDRRDELLEEEEISSVIYDMLERKLDFEKARLKRARAEVAYLQKANHQSDIVSSIGGIVTQRSVVDGMSVAQGQPLMEVTQIDPVKLRVRLPEEFIPATHRGQLLQVRFPKLDLEELTAKISEVGLDIDPLTRSFEIQAKIDNREGRLKAGMEANVTLQTDKKTRIIAIPKRSVTLRNNKVVVFRIDDDVAKRRVVSLGQTYQNEVAVQRGIEEGDIVVLDPPPELTHKQKVTIQTAPSEPINE